jgi:hypothetical protein
MTYFPAEQGPLFRKEKLLMVDTSATFARTFGHKKCCVCKNEHYEEATMLPKLIQRRL